MVRNRIDKNSKEGFTPYHRVLRGIRPGINVNKSRKAIAPKPQALACGTGFTLIEMLIVVFLIGVALVGVISFFNSSLQSNFEAKNELIAAGLAQEGAELVRNLAEYKKLNGGGWAAITSALDACGRIDYRSLSDSHLCNNGGNNYVCLSGGRYQQCDSGTGNGMQRTINVQRRVDSDGDRLEIVSQVEWSGRITKATDRLYENEY